MHASYFNAVEATAYPVTIQIADGTVSVSGACIERREPLASVQISERIGNTPRLMRFADGAFCEISDSEQLAVILAANGIQSSRVSQWESSPGWITAGGVVFTVLLVLGYLYGIPSVAKIVADRTPASATDRLSREVLAIFDHQVFTPSLIPRERQRQLDAAFRTLTLPANLRQARYGLEFRKSDAIGANALALPSGIIVVTDGLVALAKDDREIFGVLAHEAGHVNHRHGLRNVLQNSLAGLVVAWFIGDISSIAAAAPTALLEAGYSRELEREADAYAIQVLRANGIPLQHLANILRRLDESHGAAGAPGALAYLSSHPATSERLQQLEVGP